MKKIIAIVCHKVTSPLIHTVNYLSSFDDNVIIIHIDGKVEIDQFVFLKKHNVLFIDERVNVQWGSFSQVLATLRLMEFSTNFSYDYFFLISGDDIPAMSNERINKILENNKGKEFIHYQDSRNYYVDPVERVKYSYPPSFYRRDNSVGSKFSRFIFKLSKNVLYKNRNYLSVPSNSFPLFKGTNWFTLSNESIVFVLEFVKNNPQLTSIFTRSLCPDEIFFHSILKLKDDLDLYNDPSAVNNALRYIDWSTGPQYPRVLDESDRDKIIASNSFFSRKMESDANFNFLLAFVDN